MMLRPSLLNPLAGAKEGPSKSVTINVPEKDSPALSAPKPAAYTREALKALNGGIGDSIVDIHVSGNEAQEQVFSRNGYVQLLQDQVLVNASTASSLRKSTSTILPTTFSNKTSIWMWRRSQGTCSGRLKPIIDVLLYPTSVSSDLVLAGYTCDPVSIAGQYLWIKRASSEEEEKDALIDLYVTTGRMKDASDPIWQTPGLGWIRIDGNFTKSLFGSVDSFLWYRPARSRSMDMQMTNPLKGAVALTEDVRQTKLIAAVRVALRHFVPVNDVKNLANLVMESKETTSANGSARTIRSERLMDFSSVYHRYDDSKGRVSASKWAALLHDAGLNMKSADVTQCYNFFDLNHSGSMVVEEYTRVLTLTDYELDLALEKIRLKLLLPCIPKDLQKQHSAQLQQNPSAHSIGSNSNNSLLSSKTDIGVIGAQSIAAHPFTGKNRIRENMTLAQIFKLINVKADDILSLDEIMDLAAKVEVFLTEEEARKIGALLDMDSNDRIDEKDFIAFMSRESNAIAKKAFRIRESAALLRRWLVRGTSERIESNAAATASKKQWKDFKHTYERSTGQKFPGFISARVLDLTLAAQGVRLSATEARELTLVVAPERSGRVYLQELHAFMGRSCRSFGELVALAERELFADLIAAYRAHRESAKTTGRDDPELLGAYKRKVEEIKRVVESVYTLAANKQERESRQDEMQHDLLTSPLDDRERDRERDEDDDEDDERARRSQVLSLSSSTAAALESASRLRNKTSLEVIPLAQAKLGFQEYFVSQNKSKGGIAEALLPNLEEWACLSILVDADVAEGDVYGVRLKPFLEGLCQYVYSTQLETTLRLSDKVLLEIVSRELKLQLYREARMAANAKRAKQPDYAAVFSLFDENQNGLISLSEFKSQLKRFQLASLSESQFAGLLAVFDKQKRGSIGFEDFRAFVEEAAEDVALEESDALLSRNDDEQEMPPSSPARKPRPPQGDASENVTNESSEDEDELDEHTTLLSNNGGAPPVAITSSADCDWLAWFLFRQACRADPADPEGLLTELETMCAETEIAQNTHITVRDLWAMLHELNIRSKLTAEQFLAGVAFVCESKRDNKEKDKEKEKAKEEDRVDYAALCSYSIRMGRAFLKQLQEKNRAIDKKFPQALASLKEYFQSLCKDDDKSAMPRFEKIFRRMDLDNDGMLSPKEFRKGLKQLHYKDVSQWPLRMCKRLFDECDRNRDGLLSIKEFTAYVLDRRSSSESWKSLSLSSAAAAESSSLTVSVTNTTADKLNLSDHDEDNDNGEEDEIFRRRRALTDHELIRKVNDVLVEIVPREANTTSSAAHLELVRSSVRRFFQRADTEFKGVVSEERFRAFLRRSGLQDALTATELRRLTEKLKRRGTGRERGETFIDYEKLCQQLIVVAESIPKSKGEEMFNRFQSAAISSANAGRAFLSLCSLVDKSLSGRVAKEDLLFVAKMMDCEMAPFDLEAMLEVVPGVVVSVNNNSSMNSSVNMSQSLRRQDTVLIDYRALNALLETFTPRDLDNRLFSSTMRSGAALPAYATMNTPSQQQQSLQQTMDFGRSLAVSTPFGQSIQTPLRPLETSFSQSMLSSSSPFLPHTLAGTAPPTVSLNNTAMEKIVRALADRLRQAIDERNRLWNARFSLRRELESLDALNCGQIGVRAMQMALNEVGVVLTGSELQAITTLFGRVDEDKLFYDSFCRMVESAGPAGKEREREHAPVVATAMSAEPYITPRVMQRLRDLKNDRKNPLDLFEVYDLDRTGVIPVHRFKEVVLKLQLLQTEHQLVRAVSDFVAAGNRSLVSYEDFCAVLEKSYRNSGLSSESSTRLPLGGAGTRRSVVDGDGFDGFRSSQSLLYEDNIPSGRDDPRELYDSLHRTANMQSSRNYSIELDAGSENNNQFADYALSPPKVSDSIALSRRPASPTRLSKTFDPYGSTTSSSLSRARTSPSKVGSKMWGSDTPLARKGNVPRVAADKWCCAVCLYVDNPITAEQCLVCDSPNYNNNKDYQVKEQCKNCTFLNGQFAEECEMCGEPLSHHKSSKRATSSSTPSMSKSCRDSYY